MNVRHLVSGALLLTCLNAVPVNCQTTATAQTNTKFDYYLASKERDYLLTGKGGNLPIPLLVQGNIDEIKNLVMAKNGIFKYAVGNIASIVIPVNTLPYFEESKAVKRMEGKPTHLVTLNDTARKRAHIAEVQEGLAPLPQPYNGKGIVMGFVDSGIDWRHDDFRDSSGTRVQFLWDQNDTSGPFIPQAFGYGEAWNKKQIDLGLASDSSGYYEYDHGSNVAGTGTGNGTCNGQNKGTCPQSDIVMVAFNFNSQNATTLTDAVQYICTVADSLKEPLVINASLGGYDGSHDGTDLQAQVIDDLILAKQPGRVFVAAAGNAGNVPYHVHDALAAGDTAFTWHKYYGGIVDIPLFADTASFNKVHFAIAVDDTLGGFKLRAQTKFSNIYPYLGKILTDTLFNSNHQRLGIIDYYGQRLDSLFSLEFVIFPDSTSYYWRIITVGPGTFDSWDFANVVYSGLPTPAQFPPIVHYKLPDSTETLCSSFQCSNQVITVSDYYDRRYLRGYNHKLDTLKNNTPGAMVGNSSAGPTRDGRLKPEITAPGGGILSTLATNWKSFYISGSGANIDSLACHVLDGGTSLASPLVAGTAGLYLNRFPTATYSEVRDAIIHCADEDAFTGNNLPNNIWGWGKLDAFKALTNCSLAVPAIVPPPVILSIFPNPMTYTASIHYDFSTIGSYKEAKIGITTMLGVNVMSVTLRGYAGNVVVEKGNLPAGVYFYSLTVDGNRMKTGKLVVL